MVRSFLRSFHFVFVYKLVPSLLHSFVRSPIVSFVFRSLLWSFVGSLVCFPDFFIRSFISFVLSFGPSVVRWFGRSLVCSIVRLFFRSLASPLVCSLSVRTFNNKLSFADPYERVNVKQSKSHSVTQRFQLYKQNLWQIRKPRVF